MNHTPFPHLMALAWSTLLCTGLASAATTTTTTPAESGVQAPATHNPQTAQRLAQQLKQHLAQRSQTGINSLQPGSASNAPLAADALIFEQHQVDRQTQLKNQLKLSAQQEATWNALLNETANVPLHRRGTERENLSTLSTPERLDRLQARQAERQAQQQAQMARRFASIKRFYAELNSEQRLVFDDQGMDALQGPRHLQQSSETGTPSNPQRAVQRDKMMRHGKV